MAANAIDLDASNTQYVDAGNQAALDLTSGDSTVEAWVNMGIYTQYMQVCGKKWQLRMEAVSPPANFGFYYWNGSSWQGNTSSVSIAVNEWHHIAVTFDDAGDQVIFYVDGTSAGTHNLSGNPATDVAPFDIGFSVQPTPWDGIIQCVRISDIKRYTENFTPSTTLLANDVNTLGLWWLKDDLTDQSDNGFDGTFQGTGSATYVEGTLNAPVSGGRTIAGARTASGARTIANSSRAASGARTSIF